MAKKPRSSGNNPAVVTLDRAATQKHVQKHHLISITAIHLHIYPKLIVWVISKFKCARPKSIICRSTEQIMYRYGYFNKNVYFAKHNNC